MGWPLLQGEAENSRAARSSCLSPTAYSQDFDAVNSPFTAKAVSVESLRANRRHPVFPLRPHSP
jgi:hypothetical protein